MSRKLSKSILSRDEISLLRNSEEPRNSELYGNLFAILNDLSNIKAITMDDLVMLDEKGKAALTHNKKTLLDTVIKEWYAERVSEEDPSKQVKCGLCNTPNKYLYYIRNRRNGKLLNVGSHCITKFPGIEGYIEQRKQLRDIQKGQLIVARRNEFYSKADNPEMAIERAQDYFNSLPILLPWTIYSKLKDTIDRMALIYSKYVNEGKKPFNSEYTSFDLFNLAVKQFNSLKDQAEIFITERQEDSLICKRREINWMLKNNQQNLLKYISEHDGLYNVDSLRQIGSVDFLKDNIDVVLLKSQLLTVEIKNIDEYGIQLVVNKFGYQEPLLYTAQIKEFMYHIGARSIIDSSYSFSDKEILAISTMTFTYKNLISVLNYIFAIVISYGCVLLLDESTMSLFLCRRGDRAIRRFDPRIFLNTYSKYVLESDTSIKKFLFGMIKGNNSTKWISKAEQEKQGIDEKIGKLYREQYLIQKEYHTRKIGNKLFEATIYPTTKDAVSEKVKVDFDHPSYIRIPLEKLRINQNSLKRVDYAILLKEDVDDKYHKNDLLFIQNTSIVQNGNIIFYTTKSLGFVIKSCEITNEKGTDKINKYLEDREQIQTYGKILYVYHDFTLKK